MSSNARQILAAQSLRTCRSRADDLPTSDAGRPVCKQPRSERRVFSAQKESGAADPEAVVEYLFGSPLTTAGGRLRSEDGHPLPYDIKRVLLEVGNERMPGNGCGGKDCVDAFFNFTLRAQKRATELDIGRLPLVLAIPRSPLALYSTTPV